MPEEVEEKILAETKIRFGEGHLSNLSKKEQERIRTMEYPKSTEQQFLINLADKKTTELMEKCGVSGYKVPEKNFHLLPAQVYEECRGGQSGDSGTEAFTCHTSQGVFVKADDMRNDNLFFGETVFHELLHFKSHFALEAKTEEAGDEEKRRPRVRASIYRSGSTVYSSMKKDREGELHAHFKGLDEAVVSYEERKFAKDTLMNLPMFQREKEWLDSPEAELIKDNISRERRVPKEYITWVSKDGKEFRAISYGHITETYDYVLNEIQKEFPDKYPAKDDISREFLKSMFDGKLLGLARIVEKTFGKGSFRVLGIMTTKPDSAINVFESLKSLRRAQLSRKNRS